MESSREFTWQMNEAQKVTTLITLTCLVALYSTVVYFGSKNSYQFLYKQKRYKNYLLTAFYAISILACVCRIV